MTSEGLPTPHDLVVSMWGCWGGEAQLKGVGKHL